MRPVYVFDGKPPELKRAQLDQRLERRGEADKGLEAAKEAGDEEAIERYSKRTIKARGGGALRGRLAVLYNGVGACAFAHEQNHHSYCSRQGTDNISWLGMALSSQWLQWWPKPTGGRKAVAAPTCQQPRRSVMQTPASSAPPLPLAGHQAAQ
jgi:hypothetical protein